MREVVFDTETTGRDPLTGDRIVEIGCVEIFNLTPTGKTFHCYLNPGRDVPEEVVRIHGLTTHFLRDKPSFSAVVDALIEFFGDSPLIAHNAEFDRGFLNAELRLIGREPFASERFVDTLVIARQKFRGATNSLDALSRRFMLDRDGFDLAARKGPGGHGALIDSKILARVYLELKGGREQALSFEDARETPSGEAAVIAFTPRAPRPAALAARITPAEEEAHAAFLATLPDPIWLKVSA